MLAIVAALLALASPAMSRAETIEFEALLHDTTVVGGPTRAWISADIEHVRGLQVVDQWSGGLVGVLERSVSYDLNLVTGVNTARCSGTLTATAPIEETWVVRCRGTLESGTWNGRGVSGTQIRGTYQLAPGGVPGLGPYLVAGTILLP